MTEEQIKKVNKLVQLNRDVCKDREGADVAKDAKEIYDFFSENFQTISQQLLAAIGQVIENPESSESLDSLVVALNAVDGVIQLDLTDTDEEEKYTMSKEESGFFYNCLFSCMVEEISVDLYYDFETLEKQILKVIDTLQIEIRALDSNLKYELATKKRICLSGLIRIPGFLEKNERFYKPCLVELTSDPEKIKIKNGLKTAIIDKINTYKKQILVPGILDQDLESSFENIKKSTKEFLDDGLFLSQRQTSLFCQQQQKALEDIVRSYNVDCSLTENNLSPIALPADSTFTDLFTEELSSIDSQLQQKFKLLDDIAELEAHAKTYQKSHPEDYQVAMTLGLALRKQTCAFFDQDKDNIDMHKVTKEVFTEKFKKTLNEHANVLQKHRGFTGIVLNIMRFLGFNMQVNTTSRQKANKILQSDIFKQNKNSVDTEVNSSYTARNSISFGCS